MTQTLQYGIHESPFGWCLLGITDEGLAHLSFLDENTPETALDVLSEYWPEMNYEAAPQITAPLVKAIFQGETPLPLAFKGTPFQNKVWKALLRIPSGKTVTYSDIALQVGSPRAVRAVGTACGKNKIAYLIPCHRVLASSGKLGGYRWGLARKEQILAYEQALSAA